MTSIIYLKGRDCQTAYKKTQLRNIPKKCTLIVSTQMESRMMGKKNTANNKQKEIGEAIYIFNKIEFKIRYNIRCYLLLLLRQKYLMTDYRKLIL